MFRFKGTIIRPNMNVPGLCLNIWPDGGSFKPKHVAGNFNIDHYIYCSVIDWNKLWYVLCLGNMLLLRGETEEIVKILNQDIQFSFRESKPQLPE